MSSKQDADPKKNHSSGDDLEEQPTELWAKRLFGDSSDPGRATGGAPPEKDPDPVRVEPEEHDTEVMEAFGADTVEMPPEHAAMAVAEAKRELSRTSAARADTMDVPAEMVAEIAAKVAAQHDKEDADEGGADEGGPPESASGEYEAPDTMEMPAHEAAMAVAAAEEELANIEVSGEEGAAARRLAEEELERCCQDATMVVDRPRTLAKLSHECRMCGRRISRPEPRRLRGSAHGEQGFRCEKCNNVFCPAHVVRVSGLWESLFSEGRFRCQLCLPATGRSRS